MFLKTWLICLSLLSFISCTSKFTKQESLVLSGGSNSAISRTEQISIYKTLNEASTKNYKGYTQEELMDACYKVLNLIDPKDSVFTHASDRIIMKRTWVISIIILTGIGHDYWIVKSSQTENAIAITLRMVRKTKDSGLFDASIYPDQIDSTNIPIQGSHLYEGEYYTFFKRLDYFLGIESVWYDCQKAEIKVSSLGMPKNLRNLCALGCEDLKPPN